MENYLFYEDNVLTNKRGLVKIGRIQKLDGATIKLEAGYTVSEFAMTFPVVVISPLFEQDDKKRKYLERLMLEAYKGKQRELNGITNMGYEITIEDKFLVEIAVSEILEDVGKYRLSGEASFELLYERYRLDFYYYQEDGMPSEVELAWPGLSDEVGQAFEDKGVIIEDAIKTIVEEMFNTGNCIGPGYTFEEYYNPTKK